MTFKQTLIGEIGERKGIIRNEIYISELSITHLIYPICTISSVVYYLLVYKWLYLHF